MLSVGRFLYLSSDQLFSILCLPDFSVEGSQVLAQKNVDQKSKSSLDRQHEN